MKLQQEVQLKQADELARHRCISANAFSDDSLRQAVVVTDLVDLDLLMVEGASPENQKDPGGSNGMGSF
jgi:hypothetical protein